MRSGAKYARLSTTAGSVPAAAAAVWVRVAAGAAAADGERGAQRRRAAVSPRGTLCQYPLLHVSRCSLRACQSSNLKLRRCFRCEKLTSSEPKLHSATGAPDRSRLLCLLASSAVSIKLVGKAIEAPDPQRAGQHFKPLGRR
eukprot:1265933-Rhodomonas_salina.2